MLENSYEVEFDEKLDVFKFISIGPKGAIKKAIHYVEIFPNVYNLGFGDVNLHSNEIHDEVISNNGDSQKVLITVARTLFVFTDRYPDVRVFFKGSSPARTRLYRIGICNNLEIIEKEFYVFGRIGNGWYSFRKNVAYEMFSVRRKK